MTCPLRKVPQASFEISLLGHTHTHIGRMELPQQLTFLCRRLLRRTSEEDLEESLYL